MLHTRVLRTKPFQLIHILFRIVYTQEMMMDIINIIQTHPEILIMGGI